MHHRRRLLDVGRGRMPSSPTPPLLFVLPSQAFSSTRHVPYYPLAQRHHQQPQTLPSLQYPALCSNSATAHHHHHRFSFMALSPSAANRRLHVTKRMPAPTPLPPLVLCSASKRRRRRDERASKRQVANTRTPTHGRQDDGSHAVETGVSRGSERESDRRRVAAVVPTPPRPDSTVDSESYADLDDWSGSESESESEPERGFAFAEIDPETSLVAWAGLEPGSEATAEANGSLWAEGKYETAAVIDALPMVETAFMASTTVVLYLINKVLGYFWPIDISFPVPIMYIAYRWGARQAFMGSVVSALGMLVVFGPMQSVAYLVEVAPLSLVLPQLYVLGAEWKVMALVGSIVNTLGFFAKVQLVNWFLGDDLWQALLNEVSLSIDEAMRAASTGGGTTVAGTMSSVTPALEGSSTPDVVLAAAVAASFVSSVVYVVCVLILFMEPDTRRVRLNLRRMVDHTVQL